MTTGRPSPRRGARGASDVLELGAALVAARPGLIRAVARLTEDPAMVRRLVDATLSAAWRERRRFDGASVDEWLIHTLRRQVLH